MSFPRPTRLAALLVIGTLPFAVAVATSAADEPAPLAGTVDEVDPLAGFEPAEPLPVEVEEGATVTQEACVIGDRPNVDAPIFRRPRWSRNGCRHCRAWCRRPPSAGSV